MKVYDNQFNGNEWFTIIILSITIILILILPKRYTLSTTLTFCIYGFFVGMLADHTISIPPFDFYDVNDNSSYQFFDFLTYVMYGPFGYFFIYFYDYYDLKHFKTFLYIIGWLGLAILLEFIGTKLGVYHYKQGYKLFFSIPIYLGFLSVTVTFFRAVQYFEKEKIYLNK